MSVGGEFSHCVDEILFNSAVGLVLCHVNK